MDNIKQELEKLYNEAIKLKSTQGKLTTKEVNNTILNIKEKLNEQSEKITELEKQQGDKFESLRDKIIDTRIVINQINEREYVLANNSSIKTVKEISSLSPVFLLMLMALGYFLLFVYFKFFGINDNFYLYVGINTIPIAVVFGVIVFVFQIFPALYCLHLRKEKKTNNRKSIQLFPEKWEIKIYATAVLLVSAIGYYYLLLSWEFSFFAAFI